MKRVRKGQRAKLEDEKIPYIPMNLNSMLNYLYQQSQHQELSKKLLGVENTIGSKHNLKQDMEQFQLIFAFDRLPNNNNEYQYHISPLKPFHDDDSKHKDVTSLNQNQDLLNESKIQK